MSRSRHGRSRMPSLLHRLEHRHVLPRRAGLHHVVGAQAGPPHVEGRSRGVVGVGVGLRDRAVVGEAARPRHPPRGEVAAHGEPVHPGAALAEPPAAGQPQRAGHEARATALGVQAEPGLGAPAATRGAGRSCPGSGPAGSSASVTAQKRTPSGGAPLALDQGEEVAGVVEAVGARHGGPAHRLGVGGLLDDPLGVVGAVGAQPHHPVGELGHAARERHTGHSSTQPPAGVAGNSAPRCAALPEMPLAGRAALRRAGRWGARGSTTLGRSGRATAMSSRQGSPTREDRREAVARR